MPILYQRVETDSLPHLVHKLSGITCDNVGRRKCSVGGSVVPELCRSLYRKGIGERGAQVHQDDRRRMVIGECFGQQGPEEQFAGCCCICLETSLFRLGDAGW